MTIQTTIALLIIFWNYRVLLSQVALARHLISVQMKTISLKVKKFYKRIECIELKSDDAIKKMLGQMRKKGNTNLCCINGGATIFKDCRN
jgi:hypothetical protein